MKSLRIFLPQQSAATRHLFAANFMLKYDHWWDSAFRDKYRYVSLCILAVCSAFLPIFGHGNHTMVPSSPKQMVWETCLIISRLWGVQGGCKAQGVSSPMKGKNESGFFSVYKDLCRGIWASRMQINYCTLSLAWELCNHCPWASLWFTKLHRLSHDFQILLRIAGLDDWM